MITVSYTVLLVLMGTSDFISNKTYLFCEPDNAALSCRQLCFPPPYNFSGHHTALRGLETGRMVVHVSAICISSLEEKLQGHLKRAGACPQFHSVPPFLAAAADRGTSNNWPQGGVVPSGKAGHQNLGESIKAVTRAPVTESQNHCPSVHGV